MAFPQQAEVTRTPTRVRRLEIRLYKSVDEDDPEFPRGIEYRFTVDEQHDQAMNHFHGDLLPHLTAAQKTAIESFFDQMWAKAETEAIP